MLGLLCIALALLLGIGMRIAAISGSVLLLLVWSASFPPQNDLFLDDRIIYALVLLELAVVGAGNTLGSAAVGGTPASSDATRRSRDPTGSRRA